MFRTRNTHDKRLCTAAKFWSAAIHRRFVWSPAIFIAASRTNPHLLGRAAKRPVPKAAINRRTPKLLKAAINRRSPKAARNTARADYTRKTTQPRMALAQGKALYGGGPELRAARCLTTWALPSCVTHARFTAQNPLSSGVSIPEEDYPQITMLLHNCPIIS
jgi:hypothetical protein